MPAMASIRGRYVFDYVPHRPHAVPHSANPFRATSTTAYLHPWLPEGHLTLVRPAAARLLWLGYHCATHVLVTHNC
jgi:hypothetical protein